MKRLYFTVTNDLSYDQRMHRICTSLSGAGFTVTLVGRKRKNSIALREQTFRQKRLSCFFEKGFLFYAEYNLRLFFYLLFQRMDGICAIDLDTILPCYFVSLVKRIPRLYDAHEYFTELKEVRTRPRVQKAWLSVERFCVPRFQYGYTVSAGIADSFYTTYGVRYGVIRNLPWLRDLPQVEKKEKFVLYQGAVNEGRGFEWLLPAMKSIPYPLVICGDGNFMPRLRELILANGVQEKVELKGMMLPDDLIPVAQQATLGIALAEKEGLNQYLALPNKFLDYMHAGLPQIAMSYPEYEVINQRYEVAVLLQALSVEKVAETIVRVMNDDALLQRLSANCLEARKAYCWQQEEQVLIGLYQKIFSS